MMSAREATQPEPGRQFLGEWGVTPAVCERKKAMNRLALWPEETLT